MLPAMTLWNLQAITYVRKYYKSSQNTPCSLPSRLGCRQSETITVSAQPFQHRVILNVYQTLYQTDSSFIRITLVKQSLTNV